MECYVCKKIFNQGYHNIFCSTLCMNKIFDKTNKVFVIPCLKVNDKYVCVMGNERTRDYECVEIFGGRREKDKNKFIESVYDGAVRELTEELGIVVDKKSASDFLKKSQMIVNLSVDRQGHCHYDVIFIVKLTNLDLEKCNDACEKRFQLFLKKNNGQLYKGKYVDPYAEMNKIVYINLDKIMRPRCLTIDNKIYVIFGRDQSLFNRNTKEIIKNVCDLPDLFNDYWNGYNYFEI